MKRITILVIISILTLVIKGNTVIDGLPERAEFVIAYDNVWGSIYHPVSKQCDATPTITGDGSTINKDNASEHRWIAISQEMLDSQYRVAILNDSTSPLYKGKIQYGDTVWIESDHDEINGKWIVRDAKHRRYTNSIDFLQTVGDGNLYGNNKLWNGRFDGIKILIRNTVK